MSCEVMELYDLERKWLEVHYELSLQPGEDITDVDVYVEHDGGGVVIATGSPKVSEQVVYLLVLAINPGKAQIELRVSGGSGSIVRDFVPVVVHEDPSL